MSPVNRIARKEILEMIRDGRIRWASFIVFTMLLASLGTGLVHYTQLRRLRDAAQAATRQDWLAQTPKNPHAAAHYGIYAFKPAQPLSFADRGVDDYVGVASYLEAHKENDFEYRPAADATTLARFGNWTAAGTLQLLVPLLIVLLAFPLVVGERETATLRQLVSVGVRPIDVMRGKALATITCLATLVLPAAVLGAAALALTGGGDDVAARLATLALVYVAYFAIMAGIALIVSARARSSRAALLLLLGFWAGNSLIAPRALSDVSRWLEPTPSALAFNRQLETQLARESEGANEMLTARVMRQFRVTSADGLPFNIAGITLQAGETRGNLVFDAGYGALHDAFSAQSRWQRLGAALAPLTAVRFLSMALSGTDYDEHWDFAQSAERYRRTLIRRMNMAVAFSPRDQRNAPPVGDAKLWASVAPFAYDAPTVVSILEREQTSLIILLAWVLLVAAGAYYAGTRMPIDVTARAQ